MPKPLRPWDELRPYRVGGPLRNPTDSPLSPLGLAPPYDAVGPVVAAVSAHIHSAILCADGKAWVSWRLKCTTFCVQSLRHGVVVAMMDAVALRDS